MATLRTPTDNRPHTASNGTLSQPARNHKPNYNQRHALPIPLKCYPFPTFIPHNPLSLLQAIYTLVSQTLVPPPSHPHHRYPGQFNPETGSVHVQDPEAIILLWNQGFFGKGSLSRSEPSWLDREKRRRGLLAGETSEEVTRRRREERKQFKAERARKERETIELKLREEEHARIDPTTMDREPHVVDQTTTAPSHAASIGSRAIPSAMTTSRSSAADPQCLTEGATTPYQNGRGTASVHFMEPTEIPTPNTPKPNPQEVSTFAAREGIQNQEHLQLTAEESFFLVYGLGVLNVVSPDDNQIIPTTSLLSLFRQHSYFPPCAPSSVQPDDSFLLSYIVYHHFRSLGWVVRPGVKFAVDYLLYNRGPVFSHAEFAVIVLPSYSDPHYRATLERAEATAAKEKKSWWWLHCVNRVQNQVRKSLVLAYVDVPPPPMSCEPADNPEKSTDGFQVTDIGRLLQTYRVREVMIRRWIPNRSRD
ncbi:MAG: hypothetical protein M1817_000499 [Caeruleum heppii]|nr:MAG: hypothetical protein M1817_000499 [Caeruleum heppii]